MKPWYIPLDLVLSFIAVLIRISFILFSLPFFRAKAIPPSFKAFLSLAISFVFFIPLAHKIEPLPIAPVSIGSVILGEVFTGIILSLSMLIILGALEVAGDIVSFQMGFGFARVADPVTGVQITLISRFFQILGTLIFFSLNGHHWLIKTIYTSFLKIPPGKFLTIIENVQIGRIINFTGLIFTLAFKLAAPIIIVLFLSEIGMGLIVKFAPQINILIVSFAFTIIIGILFAALSIEAWGEEIRQAFEILFTFIFRTLFK